MAGGTRAGLSSAFDIKISGHHRRNGKKGIVQRYSGTLITVHQAGYGWIRKFIEGIPLHSRVSFRTQVNDRGLAAVNVQLEEAPAAEEAETGQGFDMANCEMLQDQFQRGGQSLPLKYEGILKKARLSGSDAGRAWDGDVYVSGKLLDGHKDLCVGDRVRFSAKVGNKGKAEAMQMEPVREVEEEEDGPEMIGTIKSFDESSGYGFICGTRITQEYGRDVFLHRKQLKAFKDEKEVFLGEIKSFNPMNGYGFIHCGALFDRFKRDVFLHESQFEGLKVGDCLAPTWTTGSTVSVCDSGVTFVIQMKKGAPQALEVKRVVFASSKKLKGTQALPVLAPAGETQDAGEAGAEAAGEAAVPSADEQSKSQLASRWSWLRACLQNLNDHDGINFCACASQRTESVQDMLDALEAGAVHARDVTGVFLNGYRKFWAGQNALMVSALNMRGAERKCRLLLEHNADVNLPSDPNGTKTTLEWTKERINPKFAAFLEAISKGEEAELEEGMELHRQGESESMPRPSNIP
ncbi:hypothetical protein AK812_SmicGene6477 [Symbiodinium microadriaticum]|uniref:CSD domain-containing protein n=1 Tax=Symbiodinium microadriaticum TaxID=2951 RepID=A0A1Q9ER33_SYMMI|nr:hypothetical protein AK812_SmicGene6477 [Symbiodinium microadriaticum]